MLGSAILLCILCCLVATVSVHGFGVTQKCSASKNSASSSQSRLSAKTNPTAMAAGAEGKDVSYLKHSWNSRDEALCKRMSRFLTKPKPLRMVACLTLITCSAAFVPLAAFAEGNVYDLPTAGARIYKSGKTPFYVGGKKQDSDSKVGTRKDPTFLKKMSNCKSDCQTPRAGTARSDCVQDCQDQVCESYEQCSFKIRQTSGNDI